jgi:hypothetical protein
VVGVGLVVEVEVLGLELELEQALVVQEELLDLELLLSLSMLLEVWAHALHPRWNMAAVTLGDLPQSQLLRETPWRMCFLVAWRGRSKQVCSSTCVLPNLVISQVILAIPCRWCFLDAQHTSDHPPPTCSSEEGVVLVLQSTLMQIEGALF